MSASSALPYSLLLILLELGLGGALVMQVVDVRGHATRGFVRATTIMLPLLLGLAFWVAFTLDGDVVEGFRIAAAPREALVWLLAAATVVSLAHNAALYSAARSDQSGQPDAPDALSIRLGWLLSALALAAIAAAAAMLQGSPRGLAALSLLAGSLAIGLAAVGLTLGHWYLVTPRLPARPLNEVTGAFLLIVVVQIILFGIALAVPVETPIGGRDRPLADDVTFWLRIVVGFALPLIFGWMAWTTSRMRSMMAATGLLYLTTAAVLAGQIAAHALMFDSARPI